MNKYLLFCILIVFCFAGCQGGSCLKVGGSYEGVSGDIEYCYNLEKSKETGLPVFEKNKEKEVFGIDLDQIKRIKEKFEEFSLTSLENSKAKEEKDDPIKFLLEMMKESELDK